MQSQSQFRQYLNSEKPQQLDLIKGNQIILQDRADQRQIKQNQQLQNSEQPANFGCGEWMLDAQEQLQRDIALPNSLVPLYKTLIMVTFIDVIYITSMCILMPTAGMHIIQDYISESIYTQFSIYWFTSGIYIILIIFLMTKVTIYRARICIIYGIFNFIWHIIHLTLYYSVPAYRQDKFSAIHSILYWLEMSINIAMLAGTVVLGVRLDEMVKNVKIIIPNAAPVNQNLQIQNLDETINAMNQSAGNDSVFINKNQERQVLLKEEAQYADGNYQYNNMQQHLEEERLKNWRSQYSEYAPEKKKRRIMYNFTEEAKTYETGFINQKGVLLSVGDDIQDQQQNSNNKEKVKGGSKEIQTPISLRNQRNIITQGSQIAENFQSKIVRDSQPIQENTQQNFKTKYSNFSQQEQNQNVHQEQEQKYQSEYQKMKALVKYEPVKKRYDIAPGKPIIKQKNFDHINEEPDQ